MEKSVDFLVNLGVKFLYGRRGGTPIAFRRIHGLIGVFFSRGSLIRNIAPYTLSTIQILDTIIFIAFRLFSVGERSSMKLQRWMR